MLGYEVKKNVLIVKKNKKGDPYKIHVIIQKSS